MRAEAILLSLLLAACAQDSDSPESPIKTPGAAPLMAEPPGAAAADGSIDFEDDAPPRRAHLEALLANLRLVPR